MAMKEITNRDVIPCNHFYGSGAGTPGIVGEGRRVAVTAFWFQSDTAGDTGQLRNHDNGTTHFAVETDAGGESRFFSFRHPLILPDGLSVVTSGSGSRRHLVVYKIIDDGVNITPGS